ncbi:nitrous oxide reductase family maturation protein NosD [Bacillus sp. Bva_UNVM-123]|uniref:nitrous oxide reductase family maturation protein NosD n=1 Tax=Bacillus sp. Bva_UNVM-123 TaxID=2829798 RepID=UPI00391F2E36
MSELIKGRRFYLAVLVIFLMISSNARVLAAEKMVKSGTTLQEMINNAQAGDIVKVKKGLYKESIVISKPLTLIAEEGVIIDGDGNGSVITITADGVGVSGFAIQNSGKAKDDSGIVLKGVNGALIEANKMTNVLYGIYSENSSNNTIKNNEISSFPTHFSKRGNGIHLYKGKGNLIENNKIVNVQDGIYFDFTTNSQIQQNIVKDSRYGFHFMFSEDIIAEKNLIQKNITGFMVMDSKNLQFIRNEIVDQFHFRGVGVLLYDVDNIVLEENKIKQNSAGLYFEKARYTHIKRNIIAANQVGLQFKSENEGNILRENNFIGNVVQSKIANHNMRLDDNEMGNYWDDYTSFDLTGDGIGEIPYKAGSIYDRILQKYPHWQFYFESPAIKIWNKAESMFPSIGTVNVYDEKPLVEPVKLAENMKMKEAKTTISTLFIGLLLIASSLFIIVKGRRMG